VIVYCFTNVANGKLYVGITEQELAARWCKHVAAAHNGSEYHFHRAIRKHGDVQFEGAVLEECASIDEMKAAERRWIWLLASNHAECGYNMTLGGDGVFGMKMSEESRKKMRLAKLGTKLTPEHRQRISEAAKRRYRDPEARKCTSEALLQPDVRQRMSENGKGKNVGRVVSAETRQKISETHKRRRLNKEQIEGTI